MSNYLALFLCLWGCSFAFAQEQGMDQIPITAGISYSPEPNDDDKLRDPFKSPFELEQEEQEQARKQPNLLDDMSSRLAYGLSELMLRGIYLQAHTGYWAIFQVGEDYKWFQVGIKFRDGDLVDITDGAVIFKYYPADDDTQVREVTKVLHRGEE